MSDRDTLAALLREYGALVMQGREHDADKHAEWLLLHGVVVARGALPAGPPDAITPTESQMWDLANACDSARRSQTWEPVLDLFAKFWGPKADERPDEEPV